MSQPWPQPAPSRPQPGWPGQPPPQPYAGIPSQPTTPRPPYQQPGPGQSFLGQYPQQLAPYVPPSASSAAGPQARQPSATSAAGVPAPGWSTPSTASAAAAAYGSYGSVGASQTSAGAPITGYGQPSATSAPSYGIVSSASAPSVACSASAGYGLVSDPASQQTGSPAAAPDDAADAGAPSPGTPSSGEAASSPSAASAASAAAPDPTPTPEERATDAERRLVEVEAELAVGHLEVATAAAQALQHDLRTTEDAPPGTPESSDLLDRAVDLWTRCLDAKDQAERDEEGSPIQALDLHRERWNEAMDADGVNSLNALHERAALGHSYHRCRHEYEAAEYLRPAVAGLRYLLGDSHPESIETRTWYGVTMLALGEVAKGEKELRAARDAAIRLFGLSSPRTGRVFLAHADAMRRLTHPEWPINPS